MDFLEKLANVPRRRGSSDQLKLLGKRAAGAYTRGEVNSLSGAVEKIVREEGDLNKDQIRRISEAANQSTWNEMFHEGGKRDTHFSPADADSVIEAVSEKADEIEAPNMDYLKDPPKGELSDSADLEAAFASEGGSYPSLNPHADLEGTKETLKAASDTMRYSTDKLAYALRDVDVEFYDLVKQAHLKFDHGIVQIAQAICNVVDSPSFAEEIMKTSADRLRSEGVKINPSVELEKLSHAVVVDSDHPLLKAAAKYEKLAYAYHRAIKARDALEDENRRVSGTLRDKLRGN